MIFYQYVEAPSHLTTCQGKEINSSDVNNLETLRALKLESVVASVLNVHQSLKVNIVNLK